MQIGKNYFLKDSTITGFIINDTEKTLSILHTGGKGILYLQAYDGGNRQFTTDDYTKTVTKLKNILGESYEKI